MKKSSGLTMIILILITGIVLVFGRYYSNSQTENLLEDSQYDQGDSGNFDESNGDSENDEDQNQNPENDSNENGGNNESTNHSEILNQYEEDRENLSWLEELDYQALTDGEATLVFYGDIDIESEWYNVFQSYITNQTYGEVNIVDSTYSELDTYDLNVNQSYSNVLESNPSVVIYGMPALPDKIRDISVAETEQSMTAIMNNLTSDNSETEIVVIEPHPLPAEMNNYNTRLIDYRTYMNQMSEVSNTLGLETLLIHDGFISEVDQLGASIYSFYNEDQLTLNEDGLDLYQQILDSEINGVETESE